MTDVNITRGKFCVHGQTTIVIEQRVVTCDSCGAALDPFAVLASIARNRDAAAATIRHHRNEINRLQLRLDELKREERNVKARTRRYAKELAEPTPALEPESGNVIPLRSKR